MEIRVDHVLVAHVLCSNEHYFKAEISKLCEMFYLNGYPRAFFDKVYQKFMEKQLSNPQVEEEDNAGKTVNLNIPFVGEPSYKFAKQMRTLFEATFGVKLLPVFTSSKIGDCFSLKCRTPLPYSANVVYQFSCLQDAGTTYIGQTKRHMLTRVNEHLSLHKPNSQQSEIKTHIYGCPTCHNKFLNFENFKIVKKCRTSYEARIIEALKIKKLRPKLNKQLVTKGVSYLLKVF